MPKALCMTGMVISILIFIVFLLDLVLPTTVAPFMRASPLMNIAFLICAAGLFFLSWVTWKEQV
jgi:hypothetical protein